MPAKAEILVAEDSNTQATQFALLLEDMGYAARLTSNGREAVEQVRESQPDLVLTDLEMPEMNGLEVVETLQREFPKLPVVLITARGSELIASQALQKGAASYVPKQNLASDLIPTLERILAVIAADRTSQRLGEFLAASQLSYVLENDVTLVPVLIARFQDELQQLGVCDQSGVMQVATALDEALVNAMIHGNLEISSELRVVESGKAYSDLIAQRQQEDPFCNRRVTVSVKATCDEAEFSIRDEGPGFDVNSVPDPTNPENLATISGRGLYLINAFMDSVRHNERGNEITMVKRRPEV